MWRFYSYLDVHEAGAGDVCDGRPDLLPGVDHIYAEGVYRVTPSEEICVKVYVNDVFTLPDTDFDSYHLFQDGYHGCPYPKSSWWWIGSVPI